LVVHSPPHSPPPSLPTRRSSDLSPTTSRGSSLGLFCSYSDPFRHHGRKPSRICLGTRVCPLRPTEWQVRKVGSGQGRHTENFCSDRKSTRLNSSHVSISYAVFCL